MTRMLPPPSTRRCKAPSHSVTTPPNAEPASTLSVGVGLAFEVGADALLEGEHNGGGLVEVAFL